MAQDVSAGLSGRFWLPQRPEQAVGGWLDLSGKWPRAELVESLTSPYRETDRVQQADGSWMIVAESADDDVDPETLTVHGIVRGLEGSVTLVDAQNHGRSILLNMLRDEGSERLLASYAILGSHVAGAEELYRRVRFRLRHLDSWAQLRAGLSVELAHDGSRAAMKYEAPAPEAVATVTTPGTLSLKTEFTLPQPTVRDVRFSRSAYLEWESSSNGLTMNQLWARLLDPVRALLALAANDDSPVTSLHVQTDERRWLRVIHPAIEEPESELRPSRDMLMTRPALPLSTLAHWLDEVDHLSPVPQIVAASIDSDAVLESQLIELAAAAEGLHRRLLPNARTMSDAEAKQARRLARDAVSADAREDVVTRLSHLGEPTFRQRLSVLADLAGELAPACTGDVAAWSKEVALARDGFAHLLTDRETQVNEHLILHASLRWLLTVLLLRQAGASIEDITERLRQHQDYLFFRRRAPRWLPAVYEATIA